jgi:hypothetical protein
MLAFSKNIFGTTTHLLYDNGFRWSEEIPEEAWVYGEIHPYSISDYLGTWHLKLPGLVDKKYKRMVDILGIVDPPWNELLGSKFKGGFNKLFQILKYEISEKGLDPYRETYRICQDFLWKLQPAAVDITRYNSLKAMGFNLSTFGIRNSKLQVVRYNRTTKTGRLKVMSGPGVLTLRSGHRNMLAGCRQVDFQNMEPRLLLAFLGKTVEGDLYENIQKDLGLVGDRSYIKLSIISSLYGSRVVPEISRYFAIEAWIKELESNVEDGWIRNYFERPIKVDNIVGHHLLSLWLQSSAADASLIGFSNMFKDNYNLSPHWVIHDACIFSGSGKIPEYLEITKDIKLPIVCTEIK